MVRSLALLTLLALGAGTSAAQERDPAQVDYFRAVASFFNLPPSEIAILSDWEMPADDIPVVLFMARRAGVSPEALVALHDSGQGWADLADRYRIQPSAFHVPVRDDAPAGKLENAYRHFRSKPVAEWDAIRLSDDEIVSLVNVRVLSQALRLPAERVMAETSGVSSFVQLYERLHR